LKLQQNFIKPTPSNHKECLKGGKEQRKYKLRHTTNRGQHNKTTTKTAKAKNKAIHRNRAKENAAGRPRKQEPQQHQPPTEANHLKQFEKMN
jgi:hypothetical protein